MSIVYTLELLHLSSAGSSAQQSSGDSPAATAVYRGPASQFTCSGLQPGSEYGVRVSQAVTVRAHDGTNT